jgi:hypothetical protein
MKIFGTSAILLLLATGLRAQSLTDSLFKKGKLSIEGYVDVYYSYAMSHPVGGTRPYVVNYNRDNEINVNLAYLRLSYSADRVRAAFTPGFGTYMNANYAAERQTLQNIVEANVGVKLFKDKDIWLDAGVFTSPYTNETAFSFDQLTYTRSLGTENTPYYLTGARLTIPLGPKWTAYGYLLNGWQVVQSQHDPLDFGTQLEFKPDSSWDINWDTYIGNESSAANPGYGTRYFTDFYATYNPTAKWSFSVDTYLGLQRRTEGDVMQTRPWWNATICARYTFIPGNSFSARIEHYDDPYLVLERPVTTADKFRITGGSLGYNLAITDAVLFRLEARYFNASQPLYPQRNAPDANNEGWFTAGLTARFK